MKAIRQNMDCFNKNGLFIALLRKSQKFMNPENQAKRLLIVTFLKADIDFDKYMEQITQFTYDERYFKWLNIYANPDNSTATEKRIFDTLRSSGLTIAVDVVLAISTGKALNTNKSRLIDSCSRSQIILSKDSPDKDVQLILPYNRTHHKNETVHNVTFKELCGPPNNLYPKSFCILQIYKIRKSNNASIVFSPLGFWNYETGTDKLKAHQSVESRINFFGFPLIFGKKRFTTPEANILADENLIEDDNDEQNMDKISEFISSFLNAQQSVKMYPSLGLKTAAGNWTGLLGAVVTQEVDLGLDNVIKVAERHSDMVFTHDIMISVRNIYVKPEESHNVRDIFMVPFESELSACVLGTAFIFSAVMAVYILNTRTVRVRVEGRTRLISYLLALSDAMLWISGVFSMQGSQIQPRSYSGNIIVVVSLFFALIIYNSFSAFIASMLSVKLVQLRTVADLLESDYDIGYAKNSQDEIFLRSMNETQLNQIYLRGYLHNNINTITEGLIKATKGNYGFFATGHVARKEFLKISGYKCKYDILEIHIPSTINSVAFPISQLSPYRKAINLCLIKMTEVGIHQYIKSLIAPSLPKCDQETTYQSARLNDLITSFGILVAGILISSLLVLMECFWRKKKLIYAKLRSTHKSTDDKHLGFIH